MLPSGICRAIFSGLFVLGGYCFIESMYAEGVLSIIAMALVPFLDKD